MTDKLFNWRNYLAVHPAADMFPLMETARLAELVDDIREHGQRHPIVIFNGQILDGRNRYRACQQLAIEPVCIEYVGDPFAYAWSANGQRRDLVRDQRYLIWKRCQAGSDAWKAERDRTAERANQQRSELAQNRERDGAGAFKSSPGTSCADNGRDYAAEEAKRTRTVIAKEAGVNRGSVERMDRLDKERPDLADRVARGDMKAAEAVRQLKRDKIMARGIPQIPTSKYRIIYADPPWSYGASSMPDDYATRARDHYPTMALSEICALPVREMAEAEAVLFLWVPAPFGEDAFQVVNAWGFKYKAEFIWDKVKHNVGHYNSVRHEKLYVCTRGSCQPDVPKLFDSVQSIERTDRHSEKPEEFRTIIDTLYPAGPRIELFQRGGAVPPHWHAWGAESCEASRYHAEAA